MNVLSLFDGISCAYEALKKTNRNINQYFASEIEPKAILISKTNHSDIIQLGDVKQIDGTLLPKIDLLIGGSPCTDLSIAKKDRQGLKGSRSSLFWEYVRIKKEVNPTYFILENVASMPKEDKQIITEALGVEPVMFDASLVSAQSRKRYFWTNIQFELPKDKGIVLKDILQSDAEVDERFVTKGKAFCLTSSYSKVSASPNQIEHNAKKKQRTMVIGLTKRQENNLRDINEKSFCLTSTNYKGSQANGTTLIQQDRNIRRLTPIECERLQGLPDDYTKSVVMTHRYKTLGNAFNVDVVAHILSYMACNNSTGIYTYDSISGRPRS